MPQDSNYKLRLNSRQCTIRSVTVQDQKAAFTHHDYLNKIVVEDHVQDLNTYFADFTGSVLAAKDGELEITVSKRYLDVKEIVVRIEFELYRPTAGLQFSACGSVIPDKEQCIKDGYSFSRGSNKRIFYPHMYTVASVCGAGSLGGGTGARCWFPCIDNLTSRSRFKLAITVEKNLEVVSVGKRLEAECLSEDGLKKTIRFEQANPVAPHTIGLAVGPFVKHRREIVEVYSFQNAPKKQIEKTMIHLLRGIKEFCDYLSIDFPCTNYRQVFVDRNFEFTDVMPFADMSIVSDSLLFKEDFATPDTPAGCSTLFEENPFFPQICALAHNFFGVLVPIGTEADVWLAVGLDIYLAYRYALRSWKPTKIRLPLSHRPETNGYFRDAGGPRHGTDFSLPAKAPPPGKYEKPEDWFMCSADPYELTLRQLDTLRRQSRFYDDHREQHGSAGNLFLLPLQQPPPATYPVDSALWACSGMYFGTLFARRAFFVVHMMESQVVEQSTNHDSFALLLRLHIQRGYQSRHRYIKHLKTVLESIHTSIGGSSYIDPVHQFVVDQESDDDLNSAADDHGDYLGDEYDDHQRQPGGSILVSLCEEDFLHSFTKVGDMNSSDFEKGGSNNFVDNWLRRCNFVELLGSVQYNSNNNTIELEVEQRCGTNQKCIRLPLSIRVREVDDVWPHKRVMHEPTHRYIIQINTSRNRQKGGRKSTHTKERMTKFDDPQALKTTELVTLFNSEEEDRIWVNENPLKYVILDPEMQWLCEVIEWRQSDIMFLEMMNDPELKDNVVQKFFALKQLAIPPYSTEFLHSHGDGGSAGSNGVGAVVVGAGMSPGSEGAKHFLRCACILAGCVVDYHLHPRLRAQALLSLADWQLYRRPDKACVVADENKPIEARLGSHPWVGLNLMLGAFKLIMFHPETKKLLPNDFGVPGEHAIKRAMAKSLAKIKARSGRPPDEVLSILLKLLDENDNSVNQWSDAFYLRDLLVAAGEIVSNYYNGVLYEERRISDDTTEQLGESSERSPREVLGRFYALVTHVQRYLHYDLVGNSPHQLVTAGCIQALATMESAGVLPAETPFWAYVLHDRASLLSGSTLDSVVAAVAECEWDTTVRLEAYRAILRTYIGNRGCRHVFKEFGVNDQAWIDIFRWVLETLALDPSAKLRADVLNDILQMHVASIQDRIPELDGNKSPSGLFWPLSNPHDDIEPEAQKPTADLASTLWKMFNEPKYIDGRLRMLLSQLYRSIWRLETPSICKDVAYFEPRSLGPFHDWSENGPDEPTLGLFNKRGTANSSLLYGVGNSRSGLSKELWQDGGVIKLNTSKKAKLSGSSTKVKLKLNRG